MNDPGDSERTGREFFERIGFGDATQVDTLPPSRRERLEGDDLEQLIRLKRFYGFGVLGLMAIQLVVVNAGFLLYAGLGYGWTPPEGAVQVWLTATFVQIVSVVVVITRSLFPGESTQTG